MRFDSVSVGRIEHCYMWLLMAVVVICSEIGIARLFGAHARMSVQANVPMYSGRKLFCTTYLRAPCKAPQSLYIIYQNPLCSLISDFMLWGALLGNLREVVQRVALQP